MKFELYGEVTVSAYTEVEADTLEEAIEEAEGRDVVLGGPGTGVDVSDEWVIDEPDGEPQNIREDN